MTLAEKLNLPRHPMERKINCTVCNIEFRSVPVIRGETPGDNSKIIEQHVCPNGHVFRTKPGKND